MHIDAMTLAAVADEWRALLIGARIETIIQPTVHALAIQCYAGGQNCWLYCSIHPQFARAHLMGQRPQKVVSEPPAFVMLLRKYLEGTRIEAVEQPRWERVLEIIMGYHRGDEHPRFRLILEIMGRVSNVILCNEQGMILGSLKHVGADINRYRTIAPNVLYVPPPPQQRSLAGQTLPRLEPTTVTAAQLLACVIEIDPRNGKLWQLLIRHLLGWSPPLAREAVFRATSDVEMLIEQADEAVWEKLAEQVRELAALYDDHRWQLQTVEAIDTKSGEADKLWRVIDAAVYPLEQFSGRPGMRVRSLGSVNELLDEFYERAEWRDALESLRGPIRKVLQTQRERCQRKAEYLRKEMESSEEAAQYRLYGDLLLAHQHEIQRGQESAELQNYFVTPADAVAGRGSVQASLRTALDEQGMSQGMESHPDFGEDMVKVLLDPRLDAVGNAQRYFHKYHKLRHALELVPAQIEQNQAELATIEQLIVDLKLAEDVAEIALVKAEVQTAGYLRGKPAVDKQAQKMNKKGKKGKAQKGKPVPPGGGVPLSVQSQGGFTILIGKNSRQNEDVTFHHATAQDLWLHARGVAGAHVLIKSAGRTIPQSTLEQSASLAAYYSDARGNAYVPVDYTFQRYVRRMKGAGLGMVIYERERTISAKPEGC